MKMQRTMTGLATDFVTEQMTDQTIQEQFLSEKFISSVMHQMNTSASHTVVGRTQRLVRERVNNNQTQRRMLRSLWLPLMVCSAMVVMIAHSAWAVLEQTNSLLADSTESMQVTNTPLLILTLWFLPLTMGTLVMIWYRRGRKR